jgi:hypothetical protein
MTSTAAPRFLHVANGTCTTDLIVAAGIPGAVSIWADPLYEGPVPGGLSDDELLDLRAGFLGSPDVAASAGSMLDMRRWRQVIDAHDDYDELVLWFEHDLFDQLALVQLLSWLKGRLPHTKTVSVICVGSFPGRPRFMGLGELRPEELASLLDTRQRVTAAQYALAADAWTAFRSATPEALDRLHRQDTAALPFLAAAVERFLQEYPWTTDGLSRSERRLLRLAESGAIDLMQVFPRMHDGEDVYYITDRSIDGLAETLSSAETPLLTLSRDAGANGRPLRGAIALTDIGRDVLNGRRDRIAATGIDRWLGGVHLRAGSPLWRWDEARRGIARA